MSGTCLMQISMFIASPPAIRLNDDNWFLIKNAKLLYPFGKNLGDVLRPQLFLGIGAFDAPTVQLRFVSSSWRYDVVYIDLHSCLRCQHHRDSLVSHDQPQSLALAVPLLGSRYTKDARVDTQLSLFSNRDRILVALMFHALDLAVVHASRICHDWWLCVDSQDCRTVRVAC
jgi:hypothetical protein